MPNFHSTPWLLIGILLLYGFTSSKTNNTRFSYHFERPDRLSNLRPLALREWRRNTRYSKFGARSRTFFCSVHSEQCFVIVVEIGSCSGLSGKEKALCHLEQVKTSLPRNGKLKLF
ncbi:hypothetical protein SUGI_0571070 [Cryptomeria japonica]|nr:hypothetical protein SUGI_0571070 [Cryptomeria japonica]